MAQNPFNTTVPRQVSDWFAVTPSDTVGFTQGCAIGLYATGAGNVALVSAQGNVMLVAVAAGQFLRDIFFVRINATGTTATGLFGLT